MAEKKELHIFRVYRYPSSGKVVMKVGIRTVFLLNKDLSFSTKDPYKIKPSTELELTPFRMEVEVTERTWGHDFKVIRTWRESDLPAKTSDPNAPLEHRIDVTPSALFNSVELDYIGVVTRSRSSTYAYSLAFLSMFSLLFLSYWGLLLIGFFILLGRLMDYHARSDGDPLKRKEVLEAKERIRNKAKTALDKSLNSLNEWQKLSGIQFERAVGYIFKQIGYDIVFTPPSNDKGIDLVMEKDGRKIAVQCKAYKKRVGVDVMRAVEGSKGQWQNISEFMVVSLHGFSLQATKFAKDHNILIYSIARDFLKL